MLWIESLVTKAGHGILIGRRCILAVEPGLIPILRMAWKFGIRKDGVTASLNQDPSELLTGPISEFILAIQVKLLSKKLNTWFLLKIYFTEDLEIADV